MRVSIGMVVKDLTSPQPLLGFVENARRYGHTLHSIVVAYSHKIDEAAVARIAREVMIYTVKVNEADDLNALLAERGISEESRCTLLHTPALARYGLVPYGFNRNLVLMQAILTGSEALLFVDSDISPVVLARHGDTLAMEEIDFVGSHLGAFERGAMIASCEYSGYNILPPMDFDGLEPLLRALQKDNMLPWLRRAGEHGCLALQQVASPAYAPTEKILGGNLGIQLSCFRTLPPFYSTWYTVEDTAFLGRGEDTVLGLRVKEAAMPCLDTGTFLFHDTFDDYPAVPDLAGQQSIQRRLFYACTGWIGRNPFYNWVLGRDLRALWRSQTEDIAVGARALAEHTGNDAFLFLPTALQKSYESLPLYREDYIRTLDAWKEFRQKGGL